MRYLLIPGNPPAVHFYREWKKEIEHGHAGAQVEVSSYPLLDWQDDSANAMTEVTQYHAGQLREFYHRAGGPITLVGHSLGGYFALRLLREVPDLVERSVLVYPFLRQPTRRGRWILRAVGALHGQEMVKSSLVRWRKGLELFSKDLPFVSDEEIFKTFHLARHEGVFIGRDSSPLSIDESLRQRVHVFYTPGDTWCHDHIVQALKEQVQTTECHEPHGFVTEAGFRESLFAKIAAISA